MEPTTSEDRNLEVLRIEGHDLRSPIANIRSYASMLLARKGLDARTQRAIEIIVKNADRALGLVDEWLEFSRAERGVLELHLSPVPLGSVVRMAIADEAAAFEEAGVEVDTRIDDDLPPFELDANRVRKAVRSLLWAARRRAPAGSRVEVRVCPRGDQVRVEVEDRGPPPGSEEIERCFEAAFQMVAARRMAPGLGMGLAKATALAHGGDAGLDPLPDGALHHLSFPFSRA